MIHEKGGERVAGSGGGGGGRGGSEVATAITTVRARFTDFTSATVQIISSF